MSVTSTVNRNDYIGNGSVDTYTYSFRIFQETDLLVTVVDTGGNESELALNTDYTVTDVGASQGTIVLVSNSQSWLDAGGDLETGYGITIRRVVPLTQDTDIRNQGAVYREHLEDALDKGRMIDQQQQDELDRCIKFPNTDTLAPEDSIMPTAIERADSFLKFDTDGKPVVSSSVVLSGTTVTPFMETLLDDSNSAQARTTLGVINFDFPSGTKLIFYQTSAPTGWTAVSTNDKFLRVVTAGGTGGTTGGTVPASTSLAHTHTVASHTHSVPTHQHILATEAVTDSSSTVATAYVAPTSGGTNQKLGSYNNGGSTSRDIVRDRTNTDGSSTTGSASPSTDSQLGAFAYADVIIASKD